jgi:4a-hydroxytetrahydrobiopterin dehydratase
LLTAQAKELLSQIPGWKLSGETEKAHGFKLEISRDFEFKDFAAALVFANDVGAIAESEGHHPDILIHGWNKVKVSLSTHAVGGLTENDFIVAAKIDGR